MHKQEGMIWLLTVGRQKELPGAGLAPEIAAEKVPIWKKTATGRFYYERKEGCLYGMQEEYLTDPSVRE